MSLVIAAGDLLNVRLNYDLEDYADRAFNVLHYRVATSVGTPPAMSVALAAIGQEMFAKWSALWKAAASEEVRMAGVTVCDVFPLPRSVATTYTPGAPVAGVQASEAIPLQDSPTLLKKTDVGMRWGQGRLFYVGIPESGQHEGILEPATASLLNTMGVALADTVNASSGGWSCSLTPVLCRGPEDNPVSITPITSGRLSDVIIKSQKRRRPGKGI